MGFISTFWNKYHLATANDERFWADILGGSKTDAGINVHEDTAYNLSAYYRGVSLIAGSVSTMPLHVYKRVSDSRRTRVATHQVETLLNDRPNEYMDGATFRETLQGHALTWGNGYAEIVREAGKPVALQILLPNRTKPKMDDGSSVLYYETRRDDSSAAKKIAAKNVLHIKNMGGDGFSGWSVVRRAREGIGLALGVEKYESKFFGSGAKLSGILKHPQRLSPQAAARLRETFAELYGGIDNAHKTGVLEEGMTWEALGLPYDDEKFLGSRLFQVREIGRWLGIPSVFLGDPEGESYASMEMRWLEFLTGCLRYWLAKWENAISQKLLTPAERGELYAEHRTEALVKADIKTRYESYKMGREAGFLSVNDILQRENMNPIGAQGDIYLVPSNHVDAKTLLPVEEEEATPAEQAAGNEELEILGVPDYRQTTEYSCGCVAVQSVADFFGKGEGRTEADYINELEATPEDGTAPEAIIEWCLEHGLTVEAGQNWTVDDLARCFRGGHPVICPVQMYGVTDAIDNEEVAANRNGHYVIVVGVGLGYVFFQDPSAGQRMLPAADFDAIWHDVEADGSKSEHFGIAIGDGLIQEPEPEIEDEDAKNDKGIQPEDGKAVAGGKGGNQPLTVQYFHSDGKASPESVTAIRALIRETFSRFVTKEISHAKQAAKKPAGFLESLDVYYPGFQTSLKEALTGPIRAWLTVSGVSREPESVAAEIANAHCEHSKARLLEISGQATAKTLGDVVAGECQDWALNGSTHVDYLIDNLTPQKLEATPVDLKALLGGHVEQVTEAVRQMPAPHFEVKPEVTVEIPKRGRVVRKFRRDENGLITESTEEEC